MWPWLPSLPFTWESISLWRVKSEALLLHTHNSLSNPFSLDSPKTQVDSQQIGKRKRVRELEAILEQSSNFGSL